jgi:beta-lactamase regulating signal transducer with metallopeptidase domain
MNHSLESLGWTLVHFCWQAAAIATVYAAIDRVFSRSHSHVRYFLALGTMLLMPAVALTTFVYEELQSSGSAASTGDVPLSVDFGNVTQQIISSTARVTVSHAGTALSLTAALLWLDAIWVCGVLLLSMRAVGGWWLLEKLRSRTRIEVPEPIRICFDNVCRRLAIVRPVILRLSDEVMTPIAMGAFRRVVILPLSAVSTLTAEELEVVLAHELAHVRRADYLWNLVQTFLETVFFFHPCVWWVSRCIREQRELCCDDIALETCNDPVTYATALLRLEEHRRSYLQFAMALNGSGSRTGFAARIHRILGEPVLRQPRGFVTHSLIVLSATVGVSLLPASQLFARLLPPLKSQIQAASLHLPPAEKVATPIVTPIIEPVVSVETKAAVTPQPEPNPKPVAQSRPPASEEQVGGDPAAKKTDYIDQMKAAGYDVDLDKLIAFKIHGVTPEYIRGIINAGFPKPFADDLIALKIQGITPEYIAGLRGSGIAPDNLRELIPFKIFNITPEYAAEMKAAGFGAIAAKKLIALKVQGITPEFAKSTKQQYPDATVEDLIQLKIFHIDSNFIASAKRHGFDHLSVRELVRLRISGLLDDTQQ